jgi:GDP-L-fucose synthase
LKARFQILKILVLGATGFVGKWVLEKLAQLRPEATVVGTSLSMGVDLRDKHQTSRLFQTIRPNFVINCAAYVGGIQFGYQHPAEIFANNVPMVANIFAAAQENRVHRLVQPISNCAYPAAESFFQEANFWNGPLHESVLVYGMTRKMMWVGAWAYARQFHLDTVSLILSNMYGPGDHFDEVRSHALGALVKKIVDAKVENKKEVVIWGTGNPMREWLYVEDGAEALVRGLSIPPYQDIVNIGSGQGCTIRELALLIREAVGWSGTFHFDTTKPDGAPYKTVDGSRGKELLGWTPATSLRAGIQKTVAYYLSLEH